MVKRVAVGSLDFKWNFDNSHQRRESKVIGDWGGLAEWESLKCGEFSQCGEPKQCVV